MSNNSIDPNIQQVFTNLLDETHDIFVVYDPSWKVLYANRKACDYFYEGSELAGKNFLEEFPMCKGTELFEKFAEAINNGKASEFEGRSPFSKRWMYYRVYPLQGRLAVYATDINLRKEAQRAILQNQERYYNFISQSTEGIWRCEVEEPIPTTLPVAEQLDRIFRYAYLAECNDAMAKMYGFRDAYDLMGLKLDVLMPQNEENIAYLTAFIESGYKMHDALSKEMAKDGSTKYFLNNLTGIIERGMLVRAWGTQRDITGIKEVEEKLRDAQLQLNLALLAGTAGTFVWNIKTNEVQWTKEEEALYGLPEGAFEGKLDGWSKAVHPDDLPAALEKLQSAIDTRTEVDMEFRIIWPDKSIHWILAKGQTYYDDQGQPEKMIGVNIDITKRKNAG
ncbi:MAG TPA: PAS domain-containing protein [Chitinophagaceae bacterium]